MNQQEREIISDIFRRLEQAASQPRDPEVERLIADKIRQQPYAPYAMAQTIYVQEQALSSLNQQVQELQAEVEELRNQPQGGGGLLSSIFGAGARPEPRRGAGSFSQQGGPGMGGGRPGPWGSPSGQPGQGYGQAGYGQGGYSQPGMMGGQPGMMGGGFGAQRQGSGFLGSALTTAAGVAGGMLVGNALMNAFKGGHETLGALGGDAAGAAASAAGGDVSSLSPFGGGDAAGAGDAGGAGFQDASFGGGDLGGGDFGAGDFGDDGGSGDEWV